MGDPLFIVGESAAFFGQSLAIGSKYLSRLLKTRQLLLELFALRPTPLLLFGPSRALGGKLFPVARQRAGVVVALSRKLFPLARKFRGSSLEFVQFLLRLLAQQLQLARFMVQLLSASFQLARLLGQSLFGGMTIRFRLRGPLFDLESLVLQLFISPFQLLPIGIQLGRAEIDFLVSQIVLGPRLFQFALKARSGLVQCRAFVPQGVLCSRQVRALGGQLRFGVTLPRNQVLRFALQAVLLAR
jgi:hypothetical protein